MVSGQAIAEGPPDRIMNLKADFGAVGDGVADDTDALQAAFDTRASVFIPEGTYRFTRTLYARSRSNIYGSGGGWNPVGQTHLLYDGPEGETAIRAKQAHFFQMRQLHLDGNKKAAIGIYWEYSCNEAMLEDVAIRHTTEHALFITKTWYAYFNRLVVRDNYGNGVTLSRKVGAVNYVNFTNCRFSGSGIDSGYDGEENFAVGYGFGAINAGTVINLIGCCMEANRGAGLYLEGWAVNFLVSGCYFEQNSMAGFERDVALNATGEDEDHWKVLQRKDRQPSGRWVSIIENCSGGQWGIVFDNVYIHGRNGIWFKGNGQGHPIQVRNCHGPLMIYAEHGNWEWINSYPKTQVSRLPGVIYRPEGGGYKWWRAEGVVSGHPGHRVDNNTRYVMPAAQDGLTLYVDSDNGDDANDGRSPEQAWASLQKVADLFRDCTVDTPFTVIVSGGQPVNADFANISGSGLITLRPAAAATLGVLTAKNVGCRFVLTGSNKVQLGELRIDNCDNVRVNGVDFADGCETGTRLGVWGGSNAVVTGCRFTADGDQANAGIAAHENSRVFMQDNTFSEIPVTDQARTSTGAVVHAK